MDALDILCRALERSTCARERAHLAATTASLGAQSTPLAALGAPPEFWVETDAWCAPSSITAVVWRVRRADPTAQHYTRSTLAAACAEPALWAPTRYAWRGEWHADEAMAVCVAVARYASGAMLPVEAILVRRRDEPLGVRWAGVRGSELVVPDLYELHAMHDSPRLPPATLDTAVSRLGADAPGSIHALRVMLVAPHDALTGCFLLWRLARAGDRFASASTARACAARATGITLA
jgi:hypothetical protein